MEGWVSSHGPYARRKWAIIAASALSKLNQSRRHWPQQMNWEHQTCHDAQPAAVCTGGELRSRGHAGEERAVEVFSWGRQGCCAPRHSLWLCETHGKRASLTMSSDVELWAVLTCSARWGVDQNFMRLLLSLSLYITVKPKYAVRFQTLDVSQTIAARVSLKHD